MIEGPTNPLDGNTTIRSKSSEPIKMKEEYCYPPRALGKVERLAPVSFPDASKRRRPNFRPIRFELIPNASESGFT